MFNKLNKQICATEEINKLQIDWDHENCFPIIAKNASTYDISSCFETCSSYLFLEKCLGKHK